MSEPNLSSEKGGLVSPNGNIIPEGESQTMSTATPGDACAPGSSHTKKRKRFDKLSLHESDSGDELSDDDLDLDTGNSSLISVSESESGSEGRSQVGKTSSSGTKRLKGPKRTRFDPCGSSDTAKQSLPADMVDYVDKNFRKFIDNKIINEKILELHPIPVNALSLSVPEVDDYVHEIFEARSTSINRISDQSFRKIQGKLLKVMGPVSRLWTMFDAVNSSQDPEMDFEEVSTLMEQTVTLIGQVNVALSYERRLSIMAKMTGEAEKSKKILKKNQEIFMRAKKSLFGKKFYKTLTKLARVKKASHDISSQLSKKKKVKNISSGSKYSSRQKEQPSSSTMANPQPFHKGPHFRGRGRGAQSAQAFSRGKSKVSPVLQQGTPKQSATSRSTTGKRLVKLRLSKHDSTSTSGVNSSYGCMSKSLVSAPKQKPALRRKTKLFHRKLAETNKRPKCTGNSLGDKNPFHQLSNSGSNSSLQLLKKPDGCDRPGNCRAASKESNCEGVTLSRPISEFNISCTEKRRWQPSGDKSQTPKPVCGISTFQNGGSGCGEEPTEEGRFYDKNRHERCLFLSGGEQPIQKVSLHQLQEDGLHVSVHGLRLGPSSQVVDQASQASGCFSEENRHANCDLFGRHVDHESVLNSSFKRQGHSPVGFTAIRLPNQLEEVDSDPLPSGGVLGVHTGFSSDDHTFASNENQSDHFPLSSTVTSRLNFSEGSIKDYWTHDSVNASNFPCPPPLQNFTNGSYKVPHTGTILRDNANITSISPRGADMVDKQYQSLEWQNSGDSSSRFSHFHRCIKNGVGSSMRSSVNTGSVDKTRSQFTHQCAGDESCRLWHSGFHQESEQHSCSLKVGQQDDSSLCDENGRHCFFGPGSVNQGSLGILSQESDLSDCRACERDSECRCRSKIPRSARFQRLETKSINFPSAHEGLGAFSDGFVCQQTQCSGSEVCQLETGSICSGNRCFSPAMGEGEPICISPLLADSTVSCESGEGQRSNATGDHNTNVADSAMVCNSVRDVSGGTDFDSSSIRPVKVPKRGKSSANGNPKSLSSGMEGFRRCKQAEGVSDETVQLLSEHFRRPGTNTAYNSAWDQWTSWVLQRGYDPFQAPVAIVADYLTNRFRKGDQYRTINSHRSAISAFHIQVDGIKVGQHELVKDVMKSIFHARPPQPKYQYVWDVDVVLDFIKSLGSNESISDKFLTWKLAMLLALTSGSRSSELHALDINHMVVNDSTVKFQFSVLTKNRRIGSSPPTLVFHSFPNNEFLCVIKCLSAYLERSKLWRNSVERNCLLLSYQDPHKPVVSCTIAGWLKKLMTAAGIDTSIFSAHSTRSASSSKAAFKGLSCKDIMEHANWSKVSTFRRYYHRGIKKGSSFQTAVLS